MIGSREENSDLRQHRGEVKLPHVSRWLAWLLLSMHAVFMRRYFRIEVTGADQIPKTGPFILAPTHRSRWDAFMLYCVVRGRYLYFMTSHDEVVGLQGWIMRRMGAFPINTQRPSPSVIRSCNALIARGDALVIFPEGHLFYYPPGDVHPVKPGVAWLALKFQKAYTNADLPILPVRLVYSDRRLRLRSRAQIVVGTPISVAQYTSLPEKEAIAALTAAIQNSLGDRINEMGAIESLEAVTSSRY